MEDTLRGFKRMLQVVRNIVLILVLMEDTLRELTLMKYFKQYIIVLILVLMEDTLRVKAV